MRSRLHLAGCVGGESNLYQRIYLKKGFSSFGSWILEHFKTVRMSEIQAPAGWLRWWQIQSVEIHRSPSELPLNTPPPEYNGIHKSKQIQKYKSTANAFSKLIRYIYTKSQIQRHKSNHSLTESHADRKICYKSFQWA